MSNGPRAKMRKTAAALTKAAPAAKIGGWIAAGPPPPSVKDRYGNPLRLGDAVQVVPHDRDKYPKNDDVAWRMAGVLGVVSHIERLDDASWAVDLYWTVPAFDAEGPKRGHHYARAIDVAVVGQVPHPVMQELGTCRVCARRYTIGEDGTGGRKCLVCGETFCGHGVCHVHLQHKPKEKPKAEEAKP